MTQHPNGQVWVAKQVHKRVEVDPHAQQVIDQVAERAGGLNDQSIQEIWEKLNEPRIKLDKDEHEPAKTDGAEPNPSALEAAAVDRAASIVSPSEKTPESLARSLARLERMVDQVSAMADKVSDAGTMIGKAIIALNETMDASRAFPSPLPETTPAAEAMPTTAPEKKAVAALAVQAEKSPSATANWQAEADSKATIARSAESAEASAEQRAKDLPEWIKTPPQRMGNTWREVVATEEYATADECARAADVYLLLKTYEHFQQLLGMPHGDNTLPSLTFRAIDHSIMTTDGRLIFTQSGNSGYWHDDRILTLRNMGIDLDFIRREIVPDNRECYQTVERSFGPMKKLYTMLEFTPSVDADLMRRWDELRREGRFAAVGAGASSVLGLIGLAFGLLKVDTWTKGYYTKRLFLGVPAAIIGLVGLLAILNA